MRSDCRTAAVCGLVAASLTAITFGGLRAPPGWHDEAAYLLQARLFTQGTWTAPSPPLPEFFEQYHVLVVPAIAAKYPPGQSLFLAPGVAVGLPGLMVIVAAGMTAGLLFTLVNRFGGMIAGYGAVSLWLLSPMAIQWRSSYMSEVLTSLLWLLGLQLTIRWWDRRSGTLSAALGTVVGAMAITRPLTALAFAIPLGIACAYHAVTDHRVVESFIAVGATFAVLALLPVWAYRTTGRALEAPVNLYTEQYMPWDRMGFGLDSAPAERQGPPGMVEWAAPFRSLHAGFIAQAVAPAIVQRMKYAGRHAFWRYWVIFALCAALGLLSLGRLGLLMAAQAAALVLAYGFYAHFASWDVYYLDLLPVVCGCAAIGVAVLMTALGRYREWVPSWDRIFLSGGLAVLGTLLLPGLPAAVVRSLGRHTEQEHFLTSLEHLDRPAIVFIKNGPAHDPDQQLVGLLGPPNKKWVVHDLGKRNICLAGKAARRETFLYDEAAREIRPVRFSIDSAALHEAGCS